jgi:hypothetical protein
MVLHVPQNGVSDTRMQAVNTAPELDVRYQKRDVPSNAISTVATDRRVDDAPHAAGGLVSADAESAPRNSRKSQHLLSERRK